jgi:hypothetical protein
MIHINADTNLKITIKTPYDKSKIIIPTNNKNSTVPFSFITAAFIVAL